MAQRCLYGVDKNPLAVEMAKLSLWLLTLAKDKPFKFLDHAIRCGDSLVGLNSIDQLLRFSLTENAKVRPDVRAAATADREAARRRVLLRKQIETLPSNTPQDIEEQGADARDVEDQTKRLTYAADLLLVASWEAKTTRSGDRLELGAARGGVQVQGFTGGAVGRAAKKRLRRAGIGAGFTGRWSFPRSSWIRGFRCLLSATRPLLGVQA